MTDKPWYAVHTIDEKSLTVDWFFGPGHAARKVGQFVLLLIGWFFAILPVVVTASAILNRDNPDKGWWKYSEGFELWDTTMIGLGIFLAIFIVGYFALFIANRVDNRKRDQRRTYDEERLAKRLDIAENLYAEKFGPPQLREQQHRIVIRPYADLETFELRGLYRTHGVE